MFTNRINLLLVLAMTIFVALGCSQFRERLGQSSNAPSSPAPPPPPGATPRTAQPPANNLGSLFEPGEVKKLTEELKKVRGEKIRVVIMDISANSAVVAIQNPNSKKEMEVFEWSGGRFGEPKTPKVAGSGDLESALYDLDEVALDKIPDLVNQAQEKVARSEGSSARKSVTVSIKRALPKNKDLQINVTVTAGGKKSRLIADKNGSVKEFITE